MTEQDKPGRPGKPQDGSKDRSKGKPQAADRKPRAADEAKAAPKRVARDDAPAEDAESGRIAKLLARAGVASRREVEKMVAEGRVKVNGKVLESPAVVVSLSDRIEVDGYEVEGIERTRLWIYHKPAGLVTTNKDPEGRPTVFERLPVHLPRVVSVGRLDINTEGLLLLTNDGGLARALELPSTGWLRRYRVRAHGEIDQEALDRLKDGIAVDGVLYGAIEATLDRKQGHNVWLTMGLREGKNREIKNVLGALGLDVNRLIRISFGPFQLGDLGEGDVIEIRSRTLREQLGARMIEESGANFDAPLHDHKAAKAEAEEKPKPAEAKAEREWISSSERKERARSRLSTRPDDRGERGRDDGKAGFGAKRKPFDRDAPREDRPPRRAEGAGRDERKSFDKGDRKPFDKDRKPFDKDRKPFDKGEGKDGAPARRPFVQRSRASNVWMAPGARPLSETQKAAAAKREKAAAEAGGKPRPGPRKGATERRGDEGPARRKDAGPRKEHAPRRDDDAAPRRKDYPARADGGERRRDDAAAPKRRDYAPRAEGDAGKKPYRSRREGAASAGDGSAPRKRDYTPRDGDAPRPPRGAKPAGPRGPKPAGGPRAGKPAGSFGKPGGGGPRGKPTGGKPSGGKPGGGKPGGGKPGGGPRRDGAGSPAGKGRGADRRR